jgi:hypothetical protein
MRIFSESFIFNLLTNSINNAVSEQGLMSLRLRLEKIVPDLTRQYSNFNVDSRYLKVKVRSQHAFQISLVERVITRLTNPVIVDIGDSSGTHLNYLKALHSADNDIKCLSVNIDECAVKKIRNCGLDAVLARAEDLDNYNVNPDIILCFETLEHLSDPCRFLFNLSSKTKAKYLLVTVPYLKESRVGLGHIRFPKDRIVNAENTHIFELDPDDWKLLLSHAGWEVEFEQVYFQYPKRNILRLLKKKWKDFDFEGFYGMILRRSNAWSSKYRDWEVTDKNAG